MRHLILAIMIVLLPLRGWVGDAMATQMAADSASSTSQHHQVATEVIAAHAHDTGAAGHFDHENALQTAHDCAVQTADTASGHCGSCQICQVCHTVALSPPTAGLNMTFDAPLLPPTSATLFTSAQAALGKKPPIS